MLIERSLQRFLIGSRFLLLFCWVLTLPVLLPWSKTFCQARLQPAGKKTDSTTVTAGPEYNKGSLHNWLWGKHFREEWTTPVKVKVVNIDTLFGGLVPVKKAGSRQTLGLRLKNKEGKEYVLRSIDKTYTKALPEIFRGTFVETIANDQVSTAHPFAAITVPLMAEAAKVYHTNPQVVFLPDNVNLGEFREEFKNKLYLLEERPDGFSAGQDNFGNADDIDGTEKMLEEVLEEYDNRVDQVAFIRARLFDMFLGDWSRHEDQWRWAEFKENGFKIYRPIPRDRDQAYTKFDGLIVSAGTTAASLQYLQSVDYTIKNIKGYNFQARHLDRQLANEPTLEVWIATAKNLQQLLTDEVIEDAIKYLPQEVYAFSGAELVAKLKARRNHLVDFANEYYKVLSRRVDIAGTKKKELFEITGLPNNDVQIKLYDIDSNNARRPTPFFSRIFHSNETKEIRLYGLGGRDEFVCKGTTDRSIEIRLVGGPKEDSFYIPATFKGRVKLYDNSANNFNVAKETAMRLSEDSSVHAFDYYAFKPNFRGIKPAISYSNEDRLFVRFGYRWQKQQWRKSPFGFQSDFKVNYSVTQKAFSFEYAGIYNQIIGLWNLSVLARYDDVVDAHFSGIGNSVEAPSDVPDYYRYRNHGAQIALGLFRNFGRQHSVSIAGFYEAVTILENTDRFISKVYSLTNKSLYRSTKFLGLRGAYTFSTVNDKLFPTKGLSFKTEGEFTHNFTKNNTPLLRLTGQFGFYIPVAPSLTLGIRLGAATLNGDAEFYQLNRLGSGNTLRGFRRFRFYGKSAVYNQNELLYRFNVKSYFFSGKMGLLALLDDGRVWQPGENSTQWHMGAGGGLMIAPFNRVTITGTYTKSREDGRFNVRLGKLL